MPYGLFEIDPVTTAFPTDEKTGKPILDILKHFYVFGRFLGLTLWIGKHMGVPFGPTVLLPLQGEEEVPLSRFERAYQFFADIDQLDGVYVTVKGYNRM